MSTTTLRVPDELRARIAEQAKRSGKTSHAFMLEALEETVSLAEARADFVEEARSRQAKFEADGKYLSWDETRTWFRDRLAGKKARAPRPKTWRR